MARFAVRAGRAIRGPAKGAEMQLAAFEWTSSPAPSPELALDGSIAIACIRVDTAFRSPATETEVVKIKEHFQLFRRNSVG